jgi:hypothetical protein
MPGGTQEKRDIFHVSLPRRSPRIQTAGSNCKEGVQFLLVVQMSAFTRLLLTVATLAPVGAHAVDKETQNVVMLNGNSLTSWLSSCVPGQE